MYSLFCNKTFITLWHKCSHPPLYCVWLAEKPAHLAFMFITSKEKRRFSRSDILVSKDSQEGLGFYILWHRQLVFASYRHVGPSGYFGLGHLFSERESMGCEFKWNRSSHSKRSQQMVSSKSICSKQKTQCEAGEEKEKKGKKETESKLQEQATPD